MLNQEDQELAQQFTTVFDGSTEFHSPADKARAMKQAKAYFESTKGEASMLASFFPHYHKDCSEVGSLDVYMVMHLFGVTDDSGSLHHALKKLMVRGERGVKPGHQDVQEAIFSLIRFMEIHYPAEGQSLIRKIAVYCAIREGWATAGGNPPGG